MPAKKTAKPAKDKPPMPSVSEVIDKMEAEHLNITPPEKKRGRPSSYTKEIADQMCELLSEGVPLREICRMEGMPYWRAVYRWMEADENLSAHIARAREIGYDAIAEECLLIADTPKFGQKQVMSDDGATTTVEDMLGHRKLQIETRLKLLAKWSPSKFGDRTTLAGDPDAPLQVNSEATALLEAAIKNMELKRQANV
jgi:predicted secreted protein